MKIKNKTEIKSTPKTGDKPTLVVFLLDRTGSMADCIKETISGFNAYIKAMKENDRKAGGGGKFYLMQFDSMSFDVLMDCVPVEKAKEINVDTYVPRAATPLNDAVGTTIRNIEAKTNGYKVLFVVQTDGQENASSEWTATAIKDLIKSKESREGWTFAYLGMGVEGWTQMQSFARGTASYSNVMRAAKANTIQAYAAVAAADLKYRTSTGASGQSASHCVSGIFEGEEDQTK